MGPEQAGEEHEETAIGPEANVALVIKGIIKGIDKLLRGAGMEYAVRKDVSEMHTLSFTTHALVARLPNMHRFESHASKLPGHVSFMSFEGSAPMHGLSQSFLEGNRMQTTMPQNSQWHQRSVAIQLR